MLTFEFTDAVRAMRLEIARQREVIEDLQRSIGALRAAASETAREYGAIYRSAQAEKMRPGLETGLAMMRLQSRINGKDSWKEPVKLRVVGGEPPVPEWGHRTYDSESAALADAFGPKDGGAA